MRRGSIKGLAAATVAAGLILPNLGISPSLGDEPKGIGRLFRMGGNQSSTHENSSIPTTSGRSTPYSPALSTPASTPPGASVGPKLTPKARVSKPATEADPLVTRVSIGRADTGGQFGMFLQVYADGTVIDGEGVHKVGPDALRPVVEAVSSGDLAKLKGFCGGPAGDFIETVQVVVYERSYGRLRATAFSHSGSTQGCDHAVHHLQTVLDALQAKIAPNSGGSPAVTPTVTTGPAMNGPTVPLTSVP